jgi:tetratricopeptide (TPR) repeat protein
LGQHELAAKHYEKAFELMPDSFGRVESHCFGCESTFSGTQAQSVAERVFTTLAAKNPNKPQIHYLLGYLRHQQERGQDALPHFRRAVQLDKDYLNAWEHLGQLAEEHRLPATERDDIVFNILRLDPLGRHTSANLGAVSDLRRLWTAVEDAAKFRVKAPTTLLPLPASREEVEKQERAAKTQPNQSFNTLARYSAGGSPAASPGQALAQHQLIAAISGLIGGAGEFGLEE